MSLNMAKLINTEIFCRYTQSDGTSMQRECFSRIQWGWGRKLIRNIENGYVEDSTEGEVEITFRVLNVNIKGVHGQHTLYTF